MEEGSDNELDEPKESIIKKNCLSSATDDLDHGISYVGCSTNRELQACYEHVRTMSEIVIKQQQQAVQRELDTFFKPAVLG